MNDLITDQDQKRVVKYLLLRFSQHLTDWQRHKDCQRMPVPTTRTIDIKETTDNRLYFSGLRRCDSVWECPVCATRIAARRVQEIDNMMKFHALKGYSCTMITYTVRHDKSHSLGQVLASVKEGHRRVKSGSPYQKSKKQNHILGSLTATETTYGGNGWHSHLHELLFHRSVRYEMSYELEERYYSSVDAIRGIGLTISAGHEYLALYIEKTGRLPEFAPTEGLAKEAGLSHTKKGRSKDGQPPFSLLGEIALSPETSKPNLWAEYAKTMRGKRQLSASRNLKIAREDELGEAESKTDRTLAKIPLPLWQLLLNSDFNQGELLNAAKAGRIEEYLDKQLGSNSINLSDFEL